jgi:putative ABC transport system permease protein
VASSVHIYVVEKKQSAAVLRCLGASGWQVFFVFFLQIAVLGFLGSIVGALHGLAMQYAIPWIVHDFLPVDVNIVPAWPALAKGIAVGLIIAVLFSILPLSNMRLVAPMMILRSSVQSVKKRSKFRSLVIAAIVLFPWLFAVMQTNDWLHGSMFYGGLLAVFMLLAGVARLLLFVIRRYIPRQLPFAWRQGLSNLFRPGNQTTVLVVVIGLGAFLLTSMVLIQNSLLGQVEFTGKEGRSNTVLFDIQPYQKDDVVDMSEEFSLPVQQLVPIVTTRIHTLRGRSVPDIREDTTADVREWALTREYRVTYRDTLIDSETVLKGTFRGKRQQQDDTVWISVSDGMQRALHLEPGDEVVFNVQGAHIKTFVGSIREIDWRRVQTNFMVVFPEGVLENAPQFFVLITRIEDKETAAAFQRALVQKFPNVSAIDLTLVLNTLDQIFDKVAFVIRFMAAFSVLTGLFVLAGAILNSKYVRLKENVLLRTIGAMSRQIISLTVIEYLLLGLLSALAGSLLAVLASWILMPYFFEIAFFPDVPGILSVWLIITLLTVVVGWFNTAGLLKKSPMEVLRRET